MTSAASRKKHARQPDQQTIHLFAMCLNEERMIPYFLAHYAGWVTHFHIFDNGSTDGSLRLLAGDPRITVEPFETEADGFVLTAQRLMNDVWRRASQADWVVTAEIDEHLHHPFLPAYMRHCTAAGITAVRALGYDMAADAFPADPRPLFKHVVRGVRSDGYDKIAAFNPRAITAMQYGPGRHHAWPEGEVHWEDYRQVKLLHYKNLGSEYVNERNATLALGLHEADDLVGGGKHYRRTEEEVEHAVRDLIRRARRVPGLSASDVPADEPTFEEETAIVRASGLFDDAGYLRRYPDVAASILSPVEHFCCYGWSEGRRPNDLFDPQWYASTYGLRGRGRNNPLLDYILDGEAKDRMPSVAFDPAVYRASWSLRPDESAVRHALSPENASARKAAGLAFEEEKRLFAEADRHVAADEEPGPVIDDAGAEESAADEPTGSADVFPDFIPPTLEQPPMAGHAWSIPERAAPACVVEADVASSALDEDEDESAVAATAPARQVEPEHERPAMDVGQDEDEGTVSEPAAAAFANGSDRSPQTASGQS